MSRRRSSVSVGEAVIILLVMIVLAIGSAIVSLWNFLVETRLIWFVPVVVIGAVGLWWFAKRQAEKKRVERILSCRDEWGESMCQWLIENKIRPGDRRVSRILSRLDIWGDETFQSLIQRKISLSMTDDMVLLSWGKPSTIDQREISQRGEKFRWIYGVPRKGASYIWFKDSKVTKIKQ